VDAEEEKEAGGLWIKRSLGTVRAGRGGGGDVLKSESEVVWCAAGWWDRSGRKRGDGEEVDVGGAEG